MDIGGNGDDGSFGDLPTRPMRVKVLYTFDADARTTCLARFPDTLNVPVVAIDEQSQVGVIDLQQCVQAIVSASPEILSKLENGDFTVYNFDFTEYNTPIVGQGRLSALLAGGPAGQNKAMITGRVCKNIPALFSNGVKETLEVKFKLTPLSQPAPSQYARTVDALRSISPAMSAGFDPNAWSASMQQNKPQQQSNDYFNFDSLTNGGDNSAAMLVDMFDMDSAGSVDVSGFQQPGGVGVPETPTDSTFAFNPAFSAQSHSAPGSRTGSPIMRPVSGTHNEHLRHQSFSAQPSNFADQSRPDSRASVRSETNASHQQRHPSTQSYQQESRKQQTEVFYNEDGQPRKRAKVIQADWRGKSSFGGKSSDLRVTAATASSMHMFRPIAKRPLAPGADLEPPPRVPTPVPKRTALPRQRSQQSAASRSMLRQASTVDSEFMSDIDTQRSPEGSSPSRSVTAEYTPMDFPSSPPLIPGFNQPTPGSPGLPTLPPRMADSGYMSERGFNSAAVMESLEDDENRTPDTEDLEMVTCYRSRNHKQDVNVKIEGSVVGETPSYIIDEHPVDVNDPLELPGNMNLLRHFPSGRRESGHGYRPRSILERQRTIASERAPSTTSPLEDQTSLPELPASRRGSLVLPSKPAPRTSSHQQGFKASERQRRQPLQRSRTANESEAGSPAPSDTERRPRGPARSGSEKPRREIIEQRLQEAIDNGEMPVYCSHCGAIETPTWRKIYVKTVEGKPGPLDYSEGEGETIGIQSLEADAMTGETTKFLIRKSMKKTKEFQPGQGFEDVVVCNPCGLWFNKNRNMRPEDRWRRKLTSRKKKSRGGDDGLATDGIEPPSEAFFTDQVASEEAVEDIQSTDDCQAEAGAFSIAMSRGGRRARANSMQPQPPRRSSEDSSSGTIRQGAAMRRETQSSPVRSHGSQDSPIQLDMTPAQPTRRLLFPSPRQEGEVKSLESRPTRGSASPAAERTGRKLPAKVVAIDESTDVNVFEALITDKENMAPPLDESDDLAHLFEGSPFKTPLPKTPSKCTPRPQKQLSGLLKTPTQGSRKRKPLSPNPNTANNANLNANDFMTSPGSTRYFLRSTPSRLERSPGGRSVSGGSQGLGIEPSPFSRHLAQMLSDANGPLDASFTSPSRQYDFSDLPTFNTPGRDVDWRGLDEILSSEFASYEDENGAAFDSEQVAGDNV